MKRLICCLDGTWNDDRKGSSQTNVAKLYRCLPSIAADGHRQIAHYIQGIATTDGQRAQFLRGAVGLEVSERIKRGFKFLSANYEPGDEIYLFGFSRGAFEARSLASFITLIGLPERGVPFNFDAAWNVYRQTAKKRDIDALARLSADCHYPVRIRCIGVWDTVGNIGNPYRPNGIVSKRSHFHDMRLHDTIEIALQALAIDEQRATMSPTLWTLPLGAKQPPGQHVEQTWFAGTHADIGGGWPEAGLSDVTLQWMADRVTALTALSIDFERLRMSTDANPRGVLHDSARGAAFFLDRLIPYIRLVNQKAVGAIPTLRRALIGMRRTSALGGKTIALNEGVHPSVLRRFGKIVPVQSGDVIREALYMPRNLVAAIGAPIVIEKPKPAPAPVSAVPPPCLPPAPEPVSERASEPAKTSPIQSMSAPLAMATASALASRSTIGQHAPVVAKNPQPSIAQRPAR